MTTTLITGGNRGLGHEIARRLVQAGRTVWIGARDAGNGRKAADRLGGRDAARGRATWTFSSTTPGSPAK